MFPCIMLMLHRASLWTLADLVDHETMYEETNLLRRLEYRSQAFMSHLVSDLPE
jgi:hypothetical protein